MKSLIVYYSYSGNTKKVANTLKGFLSKKGSVDTFQLEPEDESKSFLGQCIRAFRKKRAIIEKAPFDTAAYDLICIGTPVWAFAPTPAINTYIDGIKNIRGKDALTFVTYGSGAGVEKCLELMKAALREKGAFKVLDLRIQQFKVDDKEFIYKAAEEVIR